MNEMNIGELLDRLNALRADRATPGGSFSAQLRIHLGKRGTEPLGLARVMSTNS